MSIETTEEELPKPIGDFIIENAKGVMGNDGMYYHYSEVCKMLKKYNEEQMAKTCFFIQDKTTSSSSATKCSNCGKEKWEHKI